MCIFIYIIYILFFLLINLPVNSQFGPLYPVIQLQVYSLFPSLQVPPFIQGVDKHSSERNKIINEHDITTLVDFAFSKTIEMPFYYAKMFCNRFLSMPKRSIFNKKITHWFVLYFIVKIVKIIFMLKDILDGLGYD